MIPKTKMREIISSEGLRVAGPGKIPEDEKALEALNFLMKKVDLPQFKNLSQTEIKMQVPDGFGSLFDSVSVEIIWDNKGTWGRVHWEYKHPGHMGRNGLFIGSVAFDVKEAKWGWRDEASHSFGYV